MLDLYDVGDPGQRASLTDLARQGRRDGWWTGYSDLLPAAARGYSVQIVPDLLQSPDYTAAVYKASQPGLNPSQLTRIVAMTQHRQRSVLDGARQVQLIVDESALLRAVGRADIMAGQLDQILDLASRPAVTVQVMAMATPQAVLSPPFTVLGFPDPADGDVVCYGGEGGSVTVSRRAADARTALDAFSALARAALSPADSAGLIVGLSQSA
jgi:hypothetical protein